MISINRTTSDDKDFKSLVILLDQVLSVTDGDEHAFYDQYNKIDGIKNVIVCYLHDEAVGCGAFKPFDTQTVEIKRMYVQPNIRGKGVASQMLNALEVWAGEIGYSHAILETGKRQEDAIALYYKAGYYDIPNYGQYIGVDNSVCMGKLL